MDALSIALIVLVVFVILVIAFVILRRKQRSGSVLAAPTSRPSAGNGS